MMCLLLLCLFYYVKTLETENDKQEKTCIYLFFSFCYLRGEQQEISFVLMFLVLFDVLNDGGC